MGAGLLARTLGNLRHLQAGFASDHVSIASVDPTQFGYKGERTRLFYDQLCAKAAIIPGVRVASLALITPLTGSSWTDTVTVEGYTWQQGEHKNVQFNAVGPRHFEALGTPLKAGREFADTDNPATAIDEPDRVEPGQQLPDPPGLHVAIVNQAFVRHFFSGRNPMGMHVAMSGPIPSSFEIVGIVNDARYRDMRSAVDPMVFIPVWRNHASQRSLVIRTFGPAPQLSTSLRRAIHEIDPQIPLLNVHTLEQDLDQNMLAERLITTLSGVFGLLALVLCAVGLYGVVAYTVTSRTHEIGIRIALGAARRSVIQLVFRDVMIMIVSGALLGTLLAFFASRTISSFLYGVTPTDPVSILATAAILVLAAFTASFIPARRAANVDPTVALRYE